MLAKRLLEIKESPHLRFHQKLCKLPKARIFLLVDLQGKNFMI